MSVTGPRSFPIVLLNACMLLKNSPCLEKKLENENVSPGAVGCIKDNMSISFSLSQYKITISVTGPRSFPIVLLNACMLRAKKLTKVIVLDDMGLEKKLENENVSPGAVGCIKDNMSISFPLSQYKITMSVTGPRSFPIVLLNADML